jgi:cytochrome P450
MTTVYDPLDPVHQADPYPAYAWLRGHDSVHFHPAQGAAPSFWALARFGDVWDAVRTPEVFSSASGLTFYQGEIETLGLAPTIVMLDPPRQTQLRSLIGRGFTPKRVADLEDTISRYVRDRLDVMREKTAAGEEVDLHQDFGTKIPTFVLAELLGVPEQERERFDPWVGALTAAQNDGLDATRLAVGDAVVEMFTFFSEIVTERRKEPSEDLIGQLVAAELDGERLTDWDILGFLFVLVAGGNDTTGALISHTVALLDQHPDQRQLLLDDPGLIPDAIVECLRLESSVQGLARQTTRDVQVGETVIPAGQKVMMLYGSANRDEAEFGPSAATLDIRRQAARHLAFSSGPHFCIGNHLARLQATVAITELLAAHPHVSVDHERATRVLSSFTRGYDRLPGALT